MTDKPSSLLTRCAADSRKTADELVRDQRDILCRIAVELGRERENWDGEALPGEVYALRIRAETLAGIVQGFASMIRYNCNVTVDGPAFEECASLLASAERWAP